MTACVCEIASADEAYWIGFTTGRRYRATLVRVRPCTSHIGFIECHDAVLGPMFDVGYRDGWYAMPISRIID